MYCKQCGKEIPDDSRFCPNCGTVTDGSEKAAYPDLSNVPQTPEPPRKRKKRGGMVAILIFLGVAAVIVVGISQMGTVPTPSSVEVIMDVNEYAGISLEELQSKITNLEVGGGIELTDQNGETVHGETYDLGDSATHFTLVDGRVISLQYWAEEDVSYQKEKDIFQMFGITPDKSLEIVGNTGVAIRYSSVSEKVSEFWVQTMDQSAKTFSVVMITFDSRFAGKLPTDPDKPNLEVLEYTSITEDGVGYIVGQVRNNTNRTYSYAQVSINLYRDDTLLGSTLDNVNNLGPGQVWEFKAIVLYDDCNKYSIVEVTGF